MFIIKKLIQFAVPLDELVKIYTLYIISVVEQCAVLWHSSITKGEQSDIERTQKVALRVILGESCSTYSEALKTTGLETRSARRRKLCLKFPENV